jgi:hypothetical protein
MFFSIIRCRSDQAKIAQSKEKSGFPTREPLDDSLKAAIMP